MQRLLNAVVFLLIVLNVVAVGLLVSERPARVASRGPIWSAQSELPLGAILYLTNSHQDTGLLVFAEAKATFTGTDVLYQQLPDYGASIRRLLVEAINNGTQTKSHELTIWGLPAIQTEIRGISEGVDLTFLHTVVETDDTFYQVRFFTTSARFPGVRQSCTDSRTPFACLASLPPNTLATETIMPLMPCPECRREVSDQALACPQCGFPLRTLITESSKFHSCYGHSCFRRRPAFSIARIGVPPKAAVLFGAHQSLVPAAEQVALNRTCSFQSLKAGRLH